MTVETPAIEQGVEVKVRSPGTGERGVWRVIGPVASSPPDDRAWDVVNVRNGRHRIFRGSRLVVVRPKGAAGRRRGR